VKHFFSSLLALNKIELKFDEFELITFAESLEKNAILIRLTHLNFTQLVNNSKASSFEIRFESGKNNEKSSEILLISDEFPNSNFIKHESVSTQSIVKLPNCSLTLSYDSLYNQSVRFDYSVNESGRFEIDDVDILEFVYKEICLKSYLKSKKEDRNHLKLIGDEGKTRESIRDFDLNKQIELNENKLTIFKSKYFFFSIHQLLFNQFFLLKFLFQKEKTSNSKE